MSEIIRKSHANLVQRAAQLHIVAVRLADDIRNGNFKSIYRGYGIEFSDVRDYFPGDNVRAIDWNVTARMGKPFVRQYEEDKDLQSFFVMDRSLSMYSGSKGRSKIEASSEAAAILLFACEYISSSVGAVLFDGKIYFSCAPESGRRHIMTILSRLDEIPVKTVHGSVLSNALKGAGKLLKRRSLVFVMSDFRSAGWEDSLARLALTNDVVAVRITDPLDSEIPDIGSVSFIDPETRRSVRLPTSSSSFRRKWFEDNRNRVDLWKEFCIRHGVCPLILSTTEDAVLVLSKFFAGRRRK